MKKTLIILCLFFVLFSFFPTLYEIYYSKNLPKDRAFELVHNYVFDYNFYLSRIKEGQEGKWLVTEKYYNRPHAPSLFQIFYLYMGKLGGLFHLSAPVIYHTARIILGFILLFLIGKYLTHLFPGWWSVIAYLLVVTTGSWPILVKLGNFYRFSTYWGGWSVIDSLQRISFIPHVLLGQIFLVLFVWKFTSLPRKITSLIIWCLLGLIAGIIFPPVLITVYAIFLVMAVLERKISFPKILFILISFPALLYAQVMFKIEPWKALAMFDIQHRSILPYTEYALALGPVLPLGLAGLFLALVRKEKKFFPFISWILALGLLFAVFERVPQQSPTRFTQMLINVPLGVLATYFFYELWRIAGRLKGIIVITMITVIILGLSVMVSMAGWLTDQVRWKAQGTWLYPVGVQLVYPLKDFMDGIEFLRLNTKTNDVVLAYEAAGNYIPAYAGNFVYLGHANTPDEDGKLKIAARFFSGKMSEEEAKEFLKKENIKYIYFGPQERELGGVNDLSAVYAFITSVHSNSRVTLYKFGL